MSKYATPEQVAKLVVEYWEGSEHSNLIVLARAVLRFQEALEFYADQTNWTQMTSWGGRIHDEESPAIEDYGRKARAALDSEMRPGDSNVSFGEFES